MTANISSPTKYIWALGVGQGYFTLYVCYIVTASLSRRGPSRDPYSFLRPGQTSRRARLSLC